mmetsp:Transcript_1327/g.4336  ORF Transcript_1327/g.4336 Transcript_1327/m.4336 type:complete len:203 (-) Transcript_1327:147-755(-)
MENEEEEEKDVVDVAQTEVNDLLEEMAKRHASMLVHPSRRPPSRQEAKAEPPQPPRPKPEPLPVSLQFSSHVSSSRVDTNEELTLFSDGIFIAEESFVYEHGAKVTVWSGAWAGADSDADLYSLTVEKQSKYTRWVVQPGGTTYSETTEKGDVGKTYTLLLSAPQWKRASLERQDCAATVRRDHRFLFDDPAEDIFEAPWSD